MQQPARAPNLNRMARQESDREDLLREATALVERIELAAPDSTEVEHVVAGFRREGALSIYFGADPAYHFNSAGELRRAYIDGLLYKARDHRLVAMARVRTEEEVRLVSHVLRQDELQAVLTSMRDRLARLSEQIERDRLTIVGQAPVDADVLGRIALWLQGSVRIQVAAQPHVAQLRGA